MRQLESRPRSRGRLQPVVVSLMILVATVAPTLAQQVTGTLGQADATTTINGKQIPPPPAKFGGVIKETYKDSTP